jgi:hypothetical protein
VQRCRKGRESRCRSLGAATQNNLGNALRALGQIESSTVQLEKATDAYDAYTAALVEFTRAKCEVGVPN